MRIFSWHFVLIILTAVSVIGYPKAASATTVNVTIGPNGNLVFSPSSVTIAPGDKVKWTWGSSGHSTTSGSPGMPNGIWDSGILGQGATFNGDGNPDYLLYRPDTRQTAIWHLNNNVFINAVSGLTLPSGWTLLSH